MASPDSNGTPRLPPKLTSQTVTPKAFDDEAMTAYTFFFGPRRSLLPTTRITNFLRKVSERLLEIKPFEHLKPEVSEGTPGFLLMSPWLSPSTQPSPPTSLSPPHNPPN